MQVFRATMVMLLIAMAVPAFGQPGKHPSAGGAHPGAAPHPGGMPTQHISPQQLQQHQQMMQQQYQMEMAAWEAEIRSQQQRLALKNQRMAQGRTSNRASNAQNVVAQGANSLQVIQPSETETGRGNSARSSAGGVKGAGGKSSSSGSGSSLSSNHGSSESSRQSGHGTGGNHSTKSNENKSDNAVTQNGHHDEKGGKHEKRREVHHGLEAHHRVAGAERRVNGSDVGIVKLLEIAHRDLHRADNDYRGHRASAMRHVETAIRHLGGSVPATGTVGTGNLAQSVSDLHLREADSKLHTVAVSLRQVKRLESHHHGAIASVSEAMEELRKAFEARDSVSML